MTRPTQRRGDSPGRFALIETAFVHVTKACNLRCSYCYFSADKPMPEEMTRDEFRELLWEDLITIGPKKVVLTGGEPLLRPDLTNLLRDIRELDTEHTILRCLNTNGHLVTPELVDQLVGLVDDVRVSIDALRDRNDRLRGHGNHEAALSALDMFYAAGFEPKALITVTTVTRPDLEQLVGLLYEHNITRIKVNGVRLVGRAQARPDLLTDGQGVREEMNRAWRRAFPGLPVLKPPLEPESQTHCGVGKYLNILPNGDVFPCHMLVDRIFRCGNLREISLLEICGEGGLLEAASRLDFRDLAGRDTAVATLTKPNTCAASVWAKTRDRPIWAEAIPSIQADSPRGTKVLG